MGDHRLLSQVQFLKLLSEQYACSTDGPGETPVRWALVNAVLAMALRFKIAAGAEGDLAHISATFYRNATAVMDRLLLGTPGLLSLQALLAMAMYVRETADKNAFVVLVTNASCQRRLVGAGPKKPTEEMALSWTVLDTFEEEVRLIHEV